jgi:hypothetical protein
MSGNVAHANLVRGDSSHHCRLWRCQFTVDLGELKKAAKLSDSIFSFPLPFSKISKTKVVFYRLFLGFGQKKGSKVVLIKSEHRLKKSAHSQALKEWAKIRKFREAMYEKTGQIFCGDEHRLGRDCCWSLVCSSAGQPGHRVTD